MSSTGIKNQVESNLSVLYERHLFTPCETKEELRQWISTFLGIEFPDDTIDPNSNSNPLEFIWDVYHSALTADPDKTTFVAAAARNCAKTLGVSVLEFLLMLHFGKTIVHLAAILDQSQACISYLNNFLRIPIVKKYSKTDSSRRKLLSGLPDNPMRSQRDAKLQVIVANKESANGQRGNIICYDEVDLIDESVLSESAMIADPDRKGNPPIFIYVSSRKSAHGPMQDKIDASADPDSGIKLHKWSLADFMKKCDPETYQEHSEKVNMYIHEDKLLVKNQEDFDECLDTEKEKYEEVKVHQGCVTCPALIVCRGLAAKQQSTPTNMLRDIPYVRTLLRETKDPEKINAQLRNTKPESSGTVFNKFSQDIHFRPIKEVYKFAFGIEWTESPDYNGKPLDRITFTKLLRRFGWKIHCGVDFGYVDTAVGILVAYNRSQDKLIVIHTEFSSGYANRDWLRHIKKTIYLPYGFNLCCPDIADRSSPSMCSKLKMPARSKKPAKIDTGVQWIRARLWDAEIQDTRCMIIQEEKNKYVVKCLEKWQYKKTPIGFLYDQYDEESPYTHPIDAWRYAIDPFVMANEFTAESSQKEQKPYQHHIEMAEVDQLRHQLDDLRSHIHDHFNEEYNLNLPVDERKENDNEDNFADESNFMFTF